MGVPLTVYPRYLLCSLRFLGDYNPIKINYVGLQYGFPIGVRWDRGTSNYPLMVSNCIDFKPLNGLVTFIVDNLFHQHFPRTSSWIYLSLALHSAKPLRSAEPNGLGHILCKCVMGDDHQCTPTYVGPHPGK